jgi:hypothetical protein
VELLPRIVQDRASDFTLLIRHEKNRLARVVQNKVSPAFSVEPERPSRWRLDREMLPLTGNEDRRSGRQGGEGTFR